MVRKEERRVNGGEKGGEGVQKDHEMAGRRERVSLSWTVGRKDGMTRAWSRRDE